MSLSGFISKLNNFSRTLSSVAQNKTTSVGDRTYSVHDGGVLVAEPIPAWKRIKGTDPGPSGLYPHEVLLLSYAETYPVEGSTYQSFWWYKYGVASVGSCLSKLKTDGFLEVGGVTQSVANATVAELREVCKELGLKASGKKDELCARLLEHSEEIEANGLLQTKYFALTEAGREALAKEPYIPWIHKHPELDFDIWGIGALVKGSGKEDWLDFIWEDLDRKGKMHYATHDYGLYRNVRLTMSELLEEEGRTEEALVKAVEVECLDLGGAVNNFEPMTAAYIIEEMMPYKQSSLRSAPGVIRMIKRLAKELALDEKGLDAFATEVANRVQESAPMRVFAAEEVARIIRLEIDGEENSLARLYGKAKRRYPETMTNGYKW